MHCCCRQPGAKSCCSELPQTISAAVWKCFSALAAALLIEETRGSGVGQEGEYITVQFPDKEEWIHCSYCCRGSVMRTGLKESFCFLAGVPSVAVFPQALHPIIHTVHILSMGISENSRNLNVQSKMSDVSCIWHFCGSQLKIVEQNITVKMISICKHFIKTAEGATSGKCNMWRWTWEAPRTGFSLTQKIIFKIRFSQDWRSAMWWQ